MWVIEIISDTRRKDWYPVYLNIPKLFNVEIQAQAFIDDEKLKFADPVEVEIRRKNELHAKLPVR